MKKILMAAIAITLFTAGQSLADIGLDNGAAGGAVIKDLDTSIGVASFKFSPSPQVWLDGDSGPNYFVAGAVHNQALGTGGGKEYGMAYDATAVFWYDVSGNSSGSMQAVSGSNSAVFGTSWHR